MFWIISNQGLFYSALYKKCRLLIDLWLECMNSVRVLKMSLSEAILNSVHS